MAGFEPSSSACRRRTWRAWTTAAGPSPSSGPARTSERGQVSVRIRAATGRLTRLPGGCAYHGGGGAAAVGGGRQGGGGGGERERTERMGTRRGEYVYVLDARVFPWAGMGCWAAHEKLFQGIYPSEPPGFLALRSEKSFGDITNFVLGYSNKSFTTYFN
jgi:hypothetical protein